MPLAPTWTDTIYGENDNKEVSFKPLRWEENENRKDTPFRARELRASLCQRFHPSFPNVPRSICYEFRTSVASFAAPTICPETLIARAALNWLPMAPGLVTEQFGVAASDAVVRYAAESFSEASILELLQEAREFSIRSTTATQGILTVFIFCVSLNFGFFYHQWYLGGCMPKI